MTVVVVDGVVVAVVVDGVVAVFGQLSWVTYSS